MTVLALLLVLVVLAMATAGLSAVVLSLGPVSRSRLDRFVSRTDVPFTSANAAYVIDALARTMRWRTAGVLLASAGCFTWAVLHESLTLTTYTGVVLAAGFLVGSVVGEVGSAVSRGPGPRTASLEARQEEGYVGAWASTWPMVVGLLSVLLGIVGVALTGDGVGVGLLLATALGSWAVGRWCTRLILERPRPAEPGADVVAADDGLRSRALHAVGGAVVLAGSWAAIALGAGALAGDATRDGVVAFVAFVLMAVTARLAWRRATAAFPVSGVLHGVADSPPETEPTAAQDRSGA